MTMNCQMCASDEKGHMWSATTTKNLGASKTFNNNLLDLFGRTF